MVSDPVCTSCGKSKKPDEFYVNPNHTNGLMSRCKDCMKRDAAQWQSENRERYREIGRKHYAKDPERSRALSRERNARYRQKLKQQENENTEA